MTEPSAEAARISASPSEWTRQQTGAVIALCTACALALRLEFAFNSGVWRDEALFLAIVRFPHVGDVFDFLRYHESHPPLFYLLVRSWLAMTGGSDFSALLLCVLIGTVLIPLAYLCGRRTFGPFVGFAGALLTAVSAPLAENAAMARPYGLLPVLALLSTYGLWRLLYGDATRARSDVAIYVSATAALVYTHNWSWFVVIAQWIVVLATAALQLHPAAASLGIKWARSAATTLRTWGLSQFLLLVLFLPWVPTLVFQFNVAGHTPSSTAFLPTALSFLTVMLPVPQDKILWIVAIGLACTQVLRQKRAPHAGARDPASRGSGIAVYAGVAILACLIAYAFNAHSWTVPVRCLVTVAPLLLLVFGALIDAFPGPPIGRMLSVLATAAGMLFITAHVVMDPRANTRELAAEVTAQAQPDDLIIVSPEFLAPSFNHYFTGANEQIDFPEPRREDVTPFDRPSNEVRDHIGPEDTYRAIDRARAAGRRVWIVFPSHYSPDMHLNDPNSYTLKPMLLEETRTVEIVQYLLRAYGSPSSLLFTADDTAADSAPDFKERETNMALLFGGGASVSSPAPPQ